MSLLDELEHNQPMDGKVHVHVDNLSEFQPVIRTQEVEPTHATSQAFVLPPVGAQTPQSDYNQNVPVQILNLDPLRKRAIITITGAAAACFICTSQAQAQSLQFGGNQNADEAALFPAPATFTFESTAPLWAVLSAGPCVVGVLQERRG